ncbi:MAG: glucosidase [Acidimicrobiia bacterium]|nr:glucosidase [Acidimicrobiia bacterium]
MAGSTAEHRRLADRDSGSADWDQWGPYLSYRSWGTVREDYSPTGSAWSHFPHDHARKRAYRWGEDGLGGISDIHQYLCFSVALWNGRDPILKERLFGLTGKEGNHGEDVKEVYAHTAATPSHSYLEFLYRYPIAEFPYHELVAGNGTRSAAEPEYEIEDTAAFAAGYCDVRIKYAKADIDDILIEVEVTNRSAAAATCHVLPTLWYRNTWSWGYAAGPMGDVAERPSLRRAGSAVVADHQVLGRYYLHIENPDGVVFTENETNNEALWGTANDSPYVKDAFHRYLVGGEDSAVNNAGSGTKAASIHKIALEPEETRSVRLRLSTAEHPQPFADHAVVMQSRREEADEFYTSIQAVGLGQDERELQRTAYAGMIWTKQLYYFDIEQWLDGDPAGPNPPLSRKWGRNRDWRHLNNFDVISMPDAWEYPWYAAWDSAFHCVPLAEIDPAFAKNQIELFTREWYMHPNGQLPAYEWELGDVNPPVHAWGARRVYEIDAAANGAPDVDFLKRVFHKLLLNFTWWVNRKDVDGNNVFQGGFLGLDNVSVFNRSESLPGGGHLDQSDGTAWMAFYTLEMLALSLELARYDDVYEDLATKFFEHFLGIATAMSADDHCLWNPTDGFFYDVIRLPDGRSIPVQLRSMVGLIPLIAVKVIDQETIDRMPEFARRMRWFLERRPHLSGNVASIEETGEGSRHLASILTPERLRQILAYLLDEDEFLSPYGIRSLSKHHEHNPFSIDIAGYSAQVGYEPAESLSGLFGGNSNWRGPVWFPLNYLLIESLDRFHSYLGDDFTVEHPTGSGELLTLREIAQDLRQRLVSLFLRDESGQRPFDRDTASEIHRDLLFFHEYFDGDDGRGLGAIHQTGWTGLITDLVNRLA